MNTEISAELEVTAVNKVREMLRKGIPEAWVKLLLDGFVNITGLKTHRNGRLVGRILPYHDFHSHYGFSNGWSVMYLADGTVWMKLDDKKIGGHLAQEPVRVPFSNGEEVSSLDLWQRIRNPLWCGRNEKLEGPGGEDYGYFTAPATGEQVKLHPDFRKLCEEETAKVPQLADTQVIGGKKTEIIPQRNRGTMVIPKD